ncbi:hypothetical protein IM40_07320 [Candidatus Paracaedimonas acanthamoebae]|nr:hypothetical protein IM40_07320 [Candidatus Paracaedimonas acanthamoebae]
MKEKLQTLYYNLLLMNEYLKSETNTLCISTQELKEYSKLPPPSQEQCMLLSECIEKMVATAFLII